MRCPYCGYRESKVVDSRPADEGASIRRRRECLSCEKRFTTYETVEYLPMVVIKKDGSRHTYYNHYTGKKWGDCHNYQMVLDSGALGYDLCVKLITEAAQAE